MKREFGVVRSRCQQQTELTFFFRATGVLKRNEKQDHFTQSFFADKLSST
jgi:hypothetical protein